MQIGLHIFDPLFTGSSSLVENFNIPSPIINHYSSTFQYGELCLKKSVTKYRLQIYRCLSEMQCFLSNLSLKSISKKISTVQGDSRRLKCPLILNTCRNNRSSQMGKSIDLDNILWIKKNQIFILCRILPMQCILKG